MKILKIFGVVVGIHVFALILIFANPGCTSSSKPTPAPVDTVARADTSTAGVSLPPLGSPMAVTSGFDPNAPATVSGGNSRYVPTRPNTPAASTLSAPPVQDVTPATAYVVKAGDNLWTIAKTHHLTPGELAAQNGLSVGVVLKPGQKLLISSKTTAAAVPAGNSKAGSATATAKSPAATPAAARASGMTHTVKPGESLSTIAHQYGVTVRELGAANNIADPQKVPAGAVLVIPGWQPASGTSKGGTKSGKAPETVTPPQPKPIFNILDQNPTTPPASNEPPVNRVEDNPLTPAPKK